MIKKLLTSVFVVLIFLVPFFIRDYVSVLNTTTVFSGDCDYYDKDGKLVEWDCKMRVHPNWQKKYGECAFMVKMYKFVNPDYKRTGGAYITVIVERVKAGQWDADYTKGTLNGTYHECLDRGDEIKRRIDMARERQNKQGKSK